jgi:hypothetical protein
MMRRQMYSIDQRAGLQDETLRLVRKSPIDSPKL